MTMIMVDRHLILLVCVWFTVPRKPYEINKIVTIIWGQTTRQIRLNHHRTNNYINGWFTSISFTSIYSIIMQYVNTFSNLITVPILASSQGKNVYVAASEVRKFEKTCAFIFAPRTKSLAISKCCFAHR